MNAPSAREVTEVTLDLGVPQGPVIIDRGGRREGGEGVGGGTEERRGEEWQGEW